MEITRMRYLRLLQDIGQDALKSLNTVEFIAHMDRSIDVLSAAVGKLKRELPPAQTRKTTKRKNHV